MTKIKYFFKRGFDDPEQELEVTIDQTLPAHNFGDFNLADGGLDDLEDGLIAIGRFLCDGAVSVSYVCGEPEEEVEEEEIPEGLYVHVLAAKLHGKDVILIESQGQEADEHWVPAGGSKIGCVLIGTDTRLGMSKEAVELLKTGIKSNDAIGDISIFEATGKGWCFSWLGGVDSIKPAHEFEYCREGYSDIPHVTIPNTLPQSFVEWKEEHEREEAS